jgi:hypothetical protein
MKPIGCRRWAIAGGHVPLASAGPEPEWTSHDLLCILNASASDAHVALTLYYEGREPVGPYRLDVPARRVRHVRVNDLIDPEAPPLDTPYAGVLESDVPVVVQFSRRDTGRAANAIASLIAFADGAGG